MTGEQDSTRTTREKVEQVYKYFFVGSVALIALMAGFLAFAFGINWIFDTAGSLYWSSPDLARKAAYFVLFFVVAVGIGARLSAGGESNAE